MVLRLFSWSEDSFRGPQTLFMVHSPDSPSVDLIVAGQRLLGFDSSKSSSTASVPLDFLSSTRRRRPACRWTSSRRLLIDGQRAAGLSRVGSSSTASVPLDFLFAIP